MPVNICIPALVMVSHGCEGGRTGVVREVCVRLWIPRCVTYAGCRGGSRTAPTGNVRLRHAREACPALDAGAGIQVEGGSGFPSAETFA